MAFKAQEKRENVDNDALGQKGRMLFFPEYIQEKTHTPFLANQATYKGKSALQRSLASHRSKGPC